MKVNKNVFVFNKMVLHNIIAILARLVVIAILLIIVWLSFLVFQISIFSGAIRYNIKVIFLTMISFITMIAYLCILKDFIKWLIKIDKEKLSKKQVKIIK